MDLIVDKVNHFNEFYTWALSVSDKRVEDWFLMQGYAPTLIITAIYVIFVTKIGPKFMENREPYRLKWPIVIYNFVCIAINFHICSQLLYNTTMVGYSYSCQTVDYSDNPYEVRIAKALWWFYFSKCIEMLDTVFFVLRKKNNQVSFLHVYHHATMFPIWWMGVKWVAGGQSFFGAMVNSFIHVIMYTYYGIAALGPQYQKYLWWKRYLTIIQLIQFNIGIIHAVQSLVLSCEFPLWMQYAVVFYASTILALFLNFYFQAYIKSHRRKVKEVEEKKKGEVANGVSNGHTESKKKK
ncbi:elongation of very long chain fatty acids protein 4-like isoform X2 [Ruditapes philippinarum]|uniref:elongation of very long chain fatty acids protein 4-like isoform X2 n=1 Tax=Ruditapes philippinarum TaxID=129788 RepID=UPI00295B31AE|nr:elongation of very long chain fatty acids protein 4-like isoform X2 [Ruditapes philippinarum]